MAVHMDPVSLQVFYDWLAEKGWPKRLALAPEDFMILWERQDLPRRSYPLQIGPTQVIIKHDVDYMDLSTVRIFSTDATGVLLEPDEEAA